MRVDDEVVMDTYWGRQRGRIIRIVNFIDIDGEPIWTVTVRLKDGTELCSTARQGDAMPGVRHADAITRLGELSG